MTNYANWKILKSVINYTGDDPEKQAAARQADEELTAAVDWCNQNGYTIGEDESFYFTKQTSPESIKSARIAELKDYLNSTDYVVIKIAEGAATPTDYADIIAARQAARAEINRLENNVDNILE